MNVVANAARAGFRAVLNSAGVSVVFHKRDTGAESPMSTTTPAVTDTAEYMRGIMSHRKRSHGTPRDGLQESVPMLTVEALSCSRKPCQADRFVVAGVTYTVVDVQDAIGGLYLVSLDGPAPTTSAGDVAPPLLSAASVANNGNGTVTVTATSSESAYNRLRYRLGTQGHFTMLAYTSTSPGTSISRTTGALTNAVYEVWVQAKDAAGNESEWKNCGTVTVTGAP